MNKQLAYTFEDKVAVLRTIKYDKSSGKTYKECIQKVNQMIEDGWLCAKGWDNNKQEVVLCKSF
jgi:hypothetical protein